MAVHAALAEDAEDIVAGRAGLASMAQDGSVPGEVVALMINDCLTLVGAWRRLSGLTQNALARCAGQTQLWVNRSAGEGTWHTRDAAQVGRSDGCAGAGVGGWK